MPPPAGLPLLATNGVCHATPQGRQVLDVFTCIRHHTNLDQAGTLLSRNHHRFIKDAAAMEELFADLPEAIANTGLLADRVEFSLENLGYEFPDLSRARCRGAWPHMLRRANLCRRPEPVSGARWEGARAARHGNSI